MNNNEQTFLPGWYADPYVAGHQRFYDGRSWTALSNPATPGMQVVDASSIVTGSPVYANPVTETMVAREMSLEQLFDSAPTSPQRSGGSYDYHQSDQPSPLRPASAGPSPTVDAALGGLFNPSVGVPPPPNTQVRRRARRRRVVRLATQVAASVVLLGTISLLGFTLWENYGSNWYAERAQEELRDEYNQNTFAAAAVIPPVEATSVAPVFPDPATLAAGDPAGRLLIPSIGVDQIVVGATSTDALKSGPGLWEWGVFPGDIGNATLSGHRTTYGGPFREIGNLVPGDRIIFQSPGRPDAVFEVRESKIVPPSQVSVTQQTPGVRLTLTTCDPIGSTASRLIVQAELVEGSNAASAVPAADWTFAD